MTTPVTVPPTIETLADLLDRLGNVPLERIRFRPAPGTATAADVLARPGGPGLVRLPDVAFISWERFPNRVLPAEPILAVAPDLAVEILSPSNTEREIRGEAR